MKKILVYMLVFASYLPVHADSNPCTVHLGGVLGGRGYVDCPGPRGSIIRDYGNGNAQTILPKDYFNRTSADGEGDSTVAPEPANYIQNESSETYTQDI